MPVQGVDGPMKEGFVFTLYSYFLLSAYGRVVHSVVIVKTDILVGEQFIHVVVEYDVFRHATLQPFPFGQ